MPMSERGKDVLLGRLAAGEDGALAEVLDRYGGLVWSLVRRVVRAAQDAEDLVQEIFIDVWKSAARFDPKASSEGNFVAMIARRRLIDRRRKLDRRADVESLDEELDMPAEPDQDIVALADEAELAAQALTQLSEGQRKVLQLSIFQGLTHQEIAGRTGIPLGTVKSHARRGLIRVRELLEASSQPEEG